MGNLLHSAETTPVPQVGEGDSARPAAPALKGAARLLSRRGWLFTRLVSDTALLVLAILAARIGAPAGIGNDGALAVWLLPPIILGLMAFRGLYSGALESRSIETAGQILSITSLAAIAVIAAAALFEPSAEPAAMVARGWLFATAYLVGGRILLGAILTRARTAGIVAKPTLIVGAGEVGAEMEQSLREHPELGLSVVGYIDADPPPAERVPQRAAPVLGRPDELIRIAQETSAELVILAFSSSPDRGLVPLVRQCEANGIEVSLVPRMYESLTKRLRFENIGTLPLVGLRSVDPQGWQFAVKHLLDRVVAATALIALLPLLLITALAIRIDSPGPVLFRQRRVGRDGRAFDMLKFRSMAMADDDEDAPSAAFEVEPGFAPEASRVTTAAPGWDVSSAATRLTSCPSCSTCSRAT